MRNILCHKLRVDGRVVMKRKRKSEAFRTKKAERQENEEIEGLGTTSILDIPESILTNVVLRLTVKAIVMCKCVCKPWRRVISDPQFAKQHFANAEPCPLIRTLGGSRVSRMLYLIEPSEINVSYNSGNYSASRGVNLKLDTRLKIPLRNAEIVPPNVSDVNFPLCSSANKGGLKKRCVNVRVKEQKFQIVNSCNGFLCLSDPFYNNPLVVCNPVTGEYLNLQKTDEFAKSTKDMVSCGFGFSEESKQYKVIRMFDQGYSEFSSCPMTGKKILASEVAEVHTLGTGSWRRIGHAPSYGTKLNFPTSLNGSLHWIDMHNMTIDFIYSFDFGKEKFRSIQLPPFKDDMRKWGNLRNMTLGVLRGSLCLCVIGSFCDSMEIWILEKYGEPKTWRKFISFESFGVDRWPYGLYLPINFQRTKGVLMFQSPKSAFLYLAPEGYSWKYFRICEIKAKYEAVAHIPSFISLRDVVKGDHVRILNTNSRCTEFKLLGETKAVFLVEENRDWEMDTDNSSYSYWSDNEE